jgi:hypothetical protein
MTTTVIVKANHGWPVLVEGYQPGTDFPTKSFYGGIVPKNEERTFHVHSSMDLRIHEIQPDEEVLAPEL